MKVAALFVQTGGVYFDLEGVDPWDQARDARRYEGVYPVVAHPPCQRWGRYWSGGPNPNAPRRELGDDAGCFVAAARAVLKNGGVLEHPEASHAFKRFFETPPPRSGGWVQTRIHTSAEDVSGNRIGYMFGLNGPGWVCCVEQGHYGHPARKATWLYYVGRQPPFDLIWGPSKGQRLDEGFHSKAERDAARAAGVKPRKRLSTKENLATPVAFRDVLLALARHSRRT